MTEIAYVSVVPAESSGKLREILTQEDTGPLQWREERSRGCSEFYFSGPPVLVRQTHEFVTLWLANQKLAKLTGRTVAAPSSRPWRSAIIRTAFNAVALAAFSIVVFSGGGAFG